MRDKPRKRSRDLKAEHSPQAIQSRIAGGDGNDLLGDAVLGGVDGIITTFAVVAGASGGRLPETVIIVLGLANLIADGFSMAVSNYLSARSRQEKVEGKRRDEHWQIDQYPEGEKRELREIFRQKGITGELLDRITEAIAQNPSAWVETMLTEELGLKRTPVNPLYPGLATFLAFILFGAIPLLPFLLPDIPFRFAASFSLASAAFFTLGYWKGAVLERAPWISGLQTLAIGVIAAVLAYAVGALLGGLLNPGSATL